MSFIPWAFALLLLATSEPFIRFEVCSIDFEASPIETHATGQFFYTRRSSINVVAALEGEDGTPCTQICVSLRCRFVVGTQEEIIHKLKPQIVE